MAPSTQTRANECWVHCVKAEAAYQAAKSKNPKFTAIMAEKIRGGQLSRIRGTGANGKEYAKITRSNIVIFSEICGINPESIIVNEPDGTYFPLHELDLSIVFPENSRYTIEPQRSTDDDIGLLIPKLQHELRGHTLEHIVAALRHKHSIESAERRNCPFVIAVRNNRDTATGSLELKLWFSAPERIGEGRNMPFGFPLYTYRDTTLVSEKQTEKDRQKIEDEEMIDDLKFYPGEKLEIDPYYRSAMYRGFVKNKNKGFDDSCDFTLRINRIPPLSSMLLPSLYFELSGEPTADLEITARIVEGDRLVLVDKILTLNVSDRIA